MSQLEGSISVSSGGCLALGATVEPQPHPTYTGGQSWTCTRCARTFSEQNPTYFHSRFNPNGCPSRKEAADARS